MIKKAMLSQPMAGKTEDDWAQHQLSRACADMRRNASGF